MCLHHHQAEETLTKVWQSSASSSRQSCNVHWPAMQIRTPRAPAAVVGPSHSTYAGTLEGLASSALRNDWHSRQGGLPYASTKPKQASARR
jgi:hypothetical protein